ncbi:MAG: hypothetical protein QXE50_05790 [Nitrososphaerota archaeon]
MAGILDALSRRPTLILQEPLISTLRRRTYREDYKTISLQIELPYTQEIEPEQATRFVEDWSRRLAAGWVDKFFPGMSAEERERLINTIQSSLVRSLTAKYPAAERPRRRRGGE